MFISTFEAKGWLQLFLRNSCWDLAHIPQEKTGLNFIDTEKRFSVITCFLLPYR
jgi:hypothetical protein